MSQNILTDSREEIITLQDAPLNKSIKEGGSKALRASTVLHLYLYAAVMGFLVLIWILTILSAGLIFFWPMHPMFGWGFACGYHVVLYLSYNEKVKFLSKLRKRHSAGISLITHGWFYFSVNTYLVVLNILFSTFPWSAFVIIGWGIAFGMHVITVSLSGNPEQNQIRAPEPVEATYCPSCGGNLANRSGAKFCAYCGNNLQD